MTAAAWPELPAPGWEATGPTLHRWTQVLGKIRTALAAPVNHYWHSPLYVSARGLSTSPIPYAGELFEMELDFLEHQLVLTTSFGPRRVLPLRPQSVAEFYRALMAELAALGIEVTIWTRPVEVPDRTRFEDDHAHASYDPDAAYAFWRALLQADRVFKVFRGGFLGKCSPVHLFWGALDLAVTRFSGRRAPLYTGSAPNVGVHVMHESYSHEVSSAGFWPGDDASPPIFYSYAVPEPAGFRTRVELPAGARYDEPLGEYVLPYVVVRESADPDALLLQFLESTYAAAADLGGWDRPLLEERPPCVCERAPRQ